MADQLQDLVATAEAMIASQGVPRTPANIQRAVQMLAANPDLPRTQVARRTGLTRAPDQLYLGDGLDAAPVDAAGASAPSTQASQATQAAPGAAPTPNAQAAQQVPQNAPEAVADDDEFEEIDPTTGAPLVLLPAAAAGLRNNADAMGMDIEGGQRSLPGMEQRLALPAPSGPAAVSGPNLDNPLLPSPEPTVINMPNEASGPTITPQPSFEQSMDARGTNVIDASPQLQIYRSKKTGNLFQVNKVTGEVLDNAGRPLNSSAAQALLRTLRRL